MKAKLFSKEMKLLATSLLAFSILVIPLIAIAAPDTSAEPGPLVPECGPGGTGPCGYTDLMKLGQNFLRWSIYLVALCAVASLTYAGFLYLSSGGDSGKISTAHGIFTKVIWGIVITLAAFLIVSSILDWLGVEQAFRLL